MMEPSPFLWLSEMGLDSSIFTDESELSGSFDEQLATALRQDLENCLYNGQNSSSSSVSSTLIINNVPSSDSISSLPFEPTSGLQNTNPSDFSTMINPEIYGSAPVVLNFENDQNDHEQENYYRALNPNEEASISQGQGSAAIKTTLGVKKPSRVRPPQQTYDHIIAERKRRELLSQRFVALSTIVPGLKKTDKTSVLGDAIKYLKHLQERVKTLEEQSVQQTIESAVLVKRSRMTMEDEDSSDEKSGCSHEQQLPEIEARVSDKNILIRVHCEKKKGTMVNLLAMIEMLNLSVVTTNLTQFGRNLALDITIVTEMEKEFNLTVKEVVRKIRDAIKSNA